MDQLKHDVERKPQHRQPSSVFEANYRGELVTISYHTGIPELRTGEILRPDTISITSDSAPEKIVERDVYVLNLPGGGPGDSGGPVLGTHGPAKGKVLGVVEAGAGDTAVVIPAPQIQRALDQQR